MMGPWYRWEWPSGGTPYVLMEYATQEEAEAELGAQPPFDEDADDARFDRGVSFETDMYSDPELDRALDAFQADSVETLESDAAALDDDIHRLKEEVHKAEHEAIRRFLTGD